MIVTLYFEIDGYKSVYYSKAGNLIISYLITYITQAAGY